MFVYHIQYQDQASSHSTASKYWSIYYFLYFSWSAHINRTYSKVLNTIWLKSCDRALKTLFNWLNQYQIFISNWEQYCKTWIRQKFNLLMNELLSIVCFKICKMTEWSVQITISIKNLFIIWQIFLTVQIMHAISSFVNQYQVSASVRSLLRKKID